MKRNLLAIAIPALLLAGAANAAEVVNKDGSKLDVYGQVAAKDYVHGDDVASHGKTEARLGVWGETQVLDGVKAYAKFEWQTNSFDVDYNIDNRYAYTGLDFGSVGMLDYGKNQGVLNAVASYTDVLPVYGGEASGYLLLGTRTASVLTYTNTDLFGAVEGLDFAIQYADKGSDKFDPANKDKFTSVNNQAYGLSAQYSILDTGLQIGGAFAQSADRPAAEKGLTSFVVGANYNANNVYVAGIYSQSTRGDAVKVSGYEAVLAYGIDFEVGRLTPSVAYLAYRDNVAKSDKIQYADLGVQYDFNDNVGAYFDYKFNLIKNEKDQAAIGMTYKF